MILDTTDSQHYQFLAQRAGRVSDILKSDGLSQRAIVQIKKEGQLFINKKPKFFIDLVKPDDLIDIYLPKEKIDVDPINLPVDIIYEDSEVLVINKPPLLVVHPTKNHQGDTLSARIANYYINSNQNHKIRFVNRLDRDTTGLVVVAKNKFVHSYLQNQMGQNLIQKKYIAYVNGQIEKPFGEINLPIYRPEYDSIKRIVDNRGQKAVTKFKLLETYQQASKIECELITGRTHQIRVHMDSIGHGLIGDPLYNPISIEKFNFNRQALHAYSLNLVLPKRKKKTFIAPIPEDLIILENNLRGKIERR